jgi:hypothetical protein
VDDGDHSKCGINTMFNMGTVVEVLIFGSGFREILYLVLGWSFGFTHITKKFETAKK